MFVWLKVQAVAANSDAALFIAAGIGALAALVAAGIGVYGVFRVLQREQRERQESRLNDALAALMTILAERAVELNEWLNEPHPTLFGGTMNYRSLPDTVGGPSDARLQSAVDVAWMIARDPEDVQVLEAIGDATFMMKRGRTTWQAAEVGVVVGDIRKWRNKTITADECIAAMNDRRQFAIDSETALAKNTSDPRQL
jgi:hypothetical protein